MSACKGCGKNIVWGKTKDGKTIPLDPSAPTYAFDDETQEATRMVETRVYVSHFATCPKANDFSGSKKQINQGEKP